MRFERAFSRALGLVTMTLAWVLCGASAARAQCGTGSTRTFNALTVTPSSLSLPSIGVTEFDRGFSAVAQYTVTVEPTNGNRTRTWYLCLQATSATFPAVSGYSKPIGELQWSIDGSTWTNFSVSTQQIASSVGTATQVVYVRLLVNYAKDVPGTYGPAPLTFTASH
ncbi:MAG TPA: hypothetical protein VD948_12450 [Rhodothermales bacterium]|nr:hypothetical protein [Rhodothermales bacterium]